MLHLLLAQLSAGSDKQASDVLLPEPNQTTPELNQTTLEKGRRTGRVAIVGNGPLSDKDREAIASGAHDEVVRFNDLKNYREGEPFTLHSVRLFCGVHAPVNWAGHSDEGEWYSKLEIPLFAIACSCFEPGHNSSSPKQAAATKKVEDMLRERTVKVCSRYPLPCCARVPNVLARIWQVMTYVSEGQRSDCPSEGYRLFKGCAACGDRCVHNHSLWGPSSGHLVISYYETEAPEVHGIDVFGMNFNMTGTGHGQEERLVAEQCCSKCTFHWPPKDSYLPKQLAERIETSTKPRVLEGL